MNISLTTIAGWSAVCALVVIVLFWTYRRSRDTAYWRATSEKLGRDYGIALRDDVTAQVGDYLRWQWLTAIPVCFLVPVTLLIVTTASGGLSTPAMSYLIVAVTAAVVLYEVAMGSHRSWNRAASNDRVAHLTRPTLSQTFSPAELSLLGSGIGFAALAGGWGLLRDAQPVLATLWLLVVGAGVGLGRRVLNKVFDRPSRAHNDLELGWDDVLRHKEARELAGAIVWGLATIAFFLAVHRLFDGGNIIPIYVLGATALMISRVFRQGRGRWREPWDAHAPTP